MLPVKGCNPEVNVLYIGAYVLDKLHERKSKRIEIKRLFKICSKELSVSVEHIILTLDWLYIILAINHNGKEVFINEVD